MSYILSLKTIDKLKRHVLRNNITVEPLPLKTVRMHTSLYSDDDTCHTKVKGEELKFM